MSGVSPDIEINVGRRTRLGAAPGEGHNRWHPDIAPIAEISPGEIVEVGLRDGFDGQLDTESRDEDAGLMDMKLGHPLTGPFYVRGAEPGDVGQRGRGARARA